VLVNGDARDSLLQEPDGAICKNCQMEWLKWVSGQLQQEVDKRTCEMSLVNTLLCQVETRK
jgi:hypothetical protein